MHDFTAPPQQTSTFERRAGRSARPWVTIAAMATCIVIFFWSNAQREYTYEAVRKFGYFPAEEIYSGAFWGLITSALVHFDFFHVGFNMYWLWLLGSRLEQAIGSAKYLGFFLAAAVVSSAAQLAFSGDTGIGASGVVYAIFGFMVLLRKRYVEFAMILNAKTIQLFLIWLVGCFVVTYLGLWGIGNAAHLSGLIFGAVAALPVLARMNLLFALPAAMLAISVVSVLWAPWSLPWLSVKAYAAHEDKDYARALDLYTRIIERDPQNAWAYENRSHVHYSLGQHEQSEADMQQAEKLAPPER